MGIILQDIRESLQIFARRLGLLSASCCESCCGEEVSLVQSHILVEIRRRGEPAIGQVAEGLGIDITTFSRQAKALEERGLVTRRVSPGDRRVSLLTLTDEGRRVLEKIDLFMTTKMERIFSHLTSFEQEVAVRSLNLLNEAMARVDGGANEEDNLACCNKSDERGGEWSSPRS